MQVLIYKLCLLLATYLLIINNQVIKIIFDREILSIIMQKNDGDISS